MGAFSNLELYVDTRIESPAKNDSTKTLPEKAVGDTITFQFFVPAGEGHPTNGYTIELALQGKTFTDYIGTISGTDWRGNALSSTGTAKLSALSITPVSVPNSGYLGQVKLPVKRAIGGGDTLLVRSLSMTSGRDVDPLDVSKAKIGFVSASVCVGDFDGNGSVNLGDFLSFVDVFGKSSSDAGFDVQMDLDSNGQVDLGDFLAFVDVFGSECGSPPPPPPPSGDGVRATGSTVVIWGWGKDPLAFSYSPDGRFVIYQLYTYDYPTHDRDRPYVIARIHSDGANTRPEVHLTTLKHNTYNMAWSPDGRYIVFEDMTGNNNIDLFRIDADGSNEMDVRRNADVNNRIQLTFSSRRDHGATWSPDGRSILYHSVRRRMPQPGTKGLYKIDIEYGPRDSTKVILDFPDTGLASVISSALGPVATVGDMATLQNLSAQSSGIRDLTGLAHAINLTELNLQGNDVSDIRLLTGLTKLTRLLLAGNRISDISPLVQNTGLGSGDHVDLRANPLNNTSKNTHIATLRARGVTVLF